MERFRLRGFTEVQAKAQAQAEARAQAQAQARAQAQAQTRAYRVPLHLQPQIVNVGTRTAQYPQSAQIQGRSGSTRRQTAAIQKTTPSDRSNTPLGKSKPPVTGKTAAAPRPSEAPAGGKMSRDFLPRVAGLARRGQTPLKKVTQLKTPLAGPVPNRKIPRIDVQNLWVLANSPANTGGSGDTSDQIEEIHDTHDKWIDEVPKSSFTYLGRADDDVETLLTKDHFPEGHSTNRSSSHPDQTYDLDINLNSDATGNSDIPIDSLVASGQAAVEAFTESYQKLVEGHDHLKKKLLKMTLMNKWQQNLQGTISTEGEGSPPMTPKPVKPAKPPKPSTETTTNVKANQVMANDSSTTYYTPPNSVRRKKDVALRKMELRHVKGVPKVMQEPRTIDKVQVFGMIQEYNLEMNNFMKTMNLEPESDSNTDPDTDPDKDPDKDPETHPDNDTETDLKTHPGNDPDTDLNSEKDQGTPLFSSPAPIADSRHAGAGTGAYSDLIDQMNTMCRIAHEKLVENGSEMLGQLRPLVSAARAMNGKEKDILGRSFTELGMESIQWGSTGNREMETPFCDFLALLHSRALSQSTMTCFTSSNECEYEADNGWTSTMVERLLVSALSSLPIPIQVHSGTQTAIPDDQPWPASPRSPGLKKRILSKFISAERRVATQQSVQDDNKGVETFKIVLVGTTQMILFIILIVVCSYPEMRCLAS